VNFDELVLNFDDFGDQILVLVDHPRLGQQQRHCGIFVLSITDDLHDFHGCIEQVLVDQRKISLVRDHVVEKNDASCVDYFRVDVTERILAELDNLRRLLRFVNELETRVGLVNVAEHFQRYQMIVRHDLVVRILDVNAEQVLEYRHVESFPVLVVDVGRRRLMRQQKPDQIHQADLRLVLGDLKH
jgi:hypothetical protein